MALQAQDAAMAQDAAWSGRARCTLLLLTLAYATSIADRQLFAVLAPSIQAEIGVSDSVLGFLMGPAFAVLYTSVGIPVSHLTDVASRARVLLAGLVLWSACSAAIGLSASLQQLALARVAVGIGEAACTPAATSMLSDIYPAPQRATALGYYTSGATLGASLAYLIGGVLNDRVGWRPVFLLFAALGLVVAALLFVCVDEPARSAAPPAERLPVSSSLRLLARIRAFRLVSSAAAVKLFVTMALESWRMVFFVRCHGLTSTTVALAVALSGPCSVAGAWAGGMWSDALALKPRYGERWRLWLVASATGAGLVMNAHAYSRPRAQGIWALTVNSLAYFWTNVWLAPSFAAAQRLAPAHMRGLAVGAFIFVINIIGSALGPQFAGSLSDALEPRLGDESLRYAVLVSVGFDALSMALYVAAGSALPERPGDDALL